MKYIFSTNKYIESRSIDNYNINKDWVDKCEGKEVKFENEFDTSGICDKWSINKEWCEVIEENTDDYTQGLKDLLEVKDQIIEHQRILLQQDKREIDLLNEQIQELRHVIRNIKQIKAYIDELCK